MFPAENRLKRTTQSMSGGGGCTITQKRRKVMTREPGLNGLLNMDKISEGQRAANAIPRVMEITEDLSDQVVKIIFDTVERIRAATKPCSIIVAPVVHDDIAVGSGERMAEMEKINENLYALERGKK